MLTSDLKILAKRHKLCELRDNLELEIIRKLMKIKLTKIKRMYPFDSAESKAVVIDTGKMNIKRALKIILETLGHTNRVNL